MVWFWGIPGSRCHVQRSALKPFLWQVMPILVESRLQFSLNLFKICVLDEEVVLGEMCM